MNEQFVCIKLDREERPDLDSIYMDACQAMTGSGGWPLNVFLTPDQVPFYAGTYFPPESRMGMPAWRDVLDAVAEAWRDRRAEIDEGSARIAERLRGGGAPESVDQADEPARARRRGRGAAPAVRPGQRRLRPGAEVPAGVDARVPAAARRARHDDAHAARDGVGRHVRPGRRRLLALLGRRLLARPPLREDALRQRPARARLPPRLAGQRRPAVPDGRRRRRSTGRSPRCAGPRAASSPRSTRTPRASRASSTSGRSRRCARRSPASPTPTRRSPGSAPPTAATSRDATSRCAARATPSGRDEWRRRLYEVRSQRVWPGIDDKRLTSWNALMISALAEAGAVLERDDYLDAARDCAGLRAGRAARRPRAGCCAPGRTGRGS